ncbi:MULTISPECIES: hypothetical protein [unclassified Methylobacterium]|nr:MULTISPECIES: hypothetical protein [unclassified Methylobacterium]
MLNFYHSPGPAATPFSTGIGRNCLFDLHELQIVCAFFDWRPIV